MTSQEREAIINGCRDRFEPFCDWIFSGGGKITGDKWLGSNMHGGKPGKEGSAFLYRNTMLFTDTAEGINGWDIFRLRQEQTGHPFSEVARELAEWAGISQNSPKTPSKAQNTKKYTVITPVSKDAPKPNFKQVLKYDLQDGNSLSQAFQYLNPDGQLIYYRVRINTSRINEETGKQEKTFRPVSFTSKGWKKTDPEKPLPFYNLQVIKNAPATARVLICEGEAVTDAAQAILGTDYICLGIPGSGAADKMDFTPIIGRNIDYSPDADEPGAGAAIKFYRKAQEAGCDIKIINPPKTAGKGWDIKDGLEKEGWDKARLENHITANRMDLSEFEKIAIKKGWLKNEAQETGKPKIIFRPGEEDRVIKELEASLQGKVWQKDKLVVRIINLPEKKSYYGLHTSKNTSVIAPFNVDSLIPIASESAIWVKAKMTKDGEKLVPITPPQQILQSFLATHGSWKLPTLTGLVTCPIIRFDGSILNKKGYDELTGLYADFDPKEFQSINPNPTKKDAEEAIAFLKEAISEFPFKTDIDRSVALAAMLTSVLRPSVPHAPLFAFSAPTPGTGKTTLAKLIGIMATGNICSVLNYNRDENEFKKTIVAALIAGSPVYLIDNIIGEVDSDILNQVITEHKVTGRILGFSINTELSTMGLWIATGNNLTICGDQIRRTLFCTLDSNEERPAERQFKRNNFENWAIENRSKLVNSALTILRAYHKADKPCATELKPMNSFYEWSDLARGSLIWLEEADPLESQKEIEKSDPLRDSLRTIFNAWYERFGNKAVITKDLLAHGTCETDSQNEFYQTLTDTIPHRGELTGKSLGNWLAKHKNKVIDGLKLEDTGETRDRYIYWRIKINEF